MSLLNKLIREMERAVVEGTAIGMEQARLAREEQARKVETMGLAEIREEIEKLSSAEPYAALNEAVQKLVEALGQMKVATCSLEDSILEPGDLKGPHGFLRRNDDPEHVEASRRILMHHRDTLPGLFDAVFVALKRTPEGRPDGK